MRLRNIRDEELRPGRTALQLANRQEARHCWSRSSEVRARRHREAPLSTFDGTLIAEMSIVTSSTEKLAAAGLAAKSAVKSTLYGFRPTRICETWEPQVLAAT